METLYVWLFFLAGATIVAQGIFLLSSERALRKQRRDFDELRRNHRIREAQGSETHPSAELMTRNKELAEQISSLSSRLEQSDKMVEELQREQRKLVSARSENHELQEKIVELQNQLQTSESLLSTTASQYQEAADRHRRLESELAESRRQMDDLTVKNNDLLEMKNSLSSQLAVHEKTVEELQTIQERLPGIQSENQQLRSANQELQEEITGLRKQLGTTESRFTETATQAREVAEQNSKLQSEITELNRQLQTSQTTIEELEGEQQRIGGVNFENQQLRQEIETLRNQLHTSETRLSESARLNQEAAERCSRLESDVAGLRQQAEEGNARVRELEAVQEQLAKVESREMILRDQQHKLEAQIADLQRELSTGKEKVQELVATHERLAEMEHLCQELREENRKFEEEASRWQKRLAESEETQRQAGILRQQLEELQTKQAVVSEVNSLSDRLGESSDNPIASSSDESAANDEEIKPSVRSSGKQKWRFGIIPAAGVIAIAAAVAVGVLNTSSNKLSGSKEPSVAPETASAEPSIPIEATSKTLQRPSPASAEDEFPKQIRKINPATRVRGTFKITRPTQVYSGPSDTSALIAKIEPGMKIHVVDSRDGWLEIHSKHGRPSGFVRQTAAVRTDQN